MKKTRVLFVVESGRNHTGAAVRAYQYQDALSGHPDFSAEFVSRRPASLARLDGWVSRRRRLRFLLGPLRRLSRAAAFFHESRIAGKAASCDIVYMVQVPSLRLYRKIDRLRLSGNRPAVFMDVVDNLWRANVQRTAWNDFYAMLALADGVICENGFVARHVRAFHSRVFVVPDSPQVEVFDRRRGSTRTSETITLGWIGSPTTCSALFAIFEPLEKLFSKHPNLHLRLVGADPDRIPRFEKVSFSLKRFYDQAEMVDEVLAMDIGLFPLFATEEARARGALKAMIYMSGGVAAVCRDLGENRELIRDGENGILAEGADEWFAKLEQLVVDSGRRRAIAAAGLATIRAQFTRDRCLDTLLAAFRSQPGLEGHGSQRS